MWFIPLTLFPILACAALAALLHFRATYPRRWASKLPYVAARDPHNALVMCVLCMYHLYAAHLTFNGDMENTAANHKGAFSTLVLSCVSSSLCVQAVTTTRRRTATLSTNM